ncbi:MAG: 3-deoxy-manno-octulosonate cytidylyltransferase [Gammaproteobacteria bacterium]|nr:3-deoxy-manno-octulosonate cytidylyltransferase [Gammaproteobacteria bacterium]
MKFKVIIPARYASTRLPGKPLLAIAGQPMIAHVHAIAKNAGATEVIVATDDPRIATAVAAFGGKVCVTATTHRSGSERLAEVVTQMGYDDSAIIVNLQGDEPLMPPQLLQQVAQLLATHPEAEMATLSTPILNAADLLNSNIVKVVSSKAGYALYFSRAPIPWDRDHLQLTPAANGVTLHAEKIDFTQHHYQRHLGIYAYRSGFLRRYRETVACDLEQLESLEQLRLLYHGGRIAIACAVTPPGPGVDTEADLSHVRRIFNHE